MLHFKDITLDDKSTIEKYLKESNFNGCEYAFANMFMWRNSYRKKIAEYKDSLIILSENDTEKYYFYPAGSGNAYEAISALINHVHEHNENAKLTCVTKENVEPLNQHFKDIFDFSATRDWFDYIYDSKSLIELSGRKYHSKRNHINKFISNYGDVVYEDITSNNITECESAYALWLEGKGGDLAEYTEEAEAINECFKHFDKMGLVGGLIRVNNKVCAFTIRSEINKDMFCIHVEKCILECKGGYAVINREFAKRHGYKYKYINREEDLGIEGLRKSKLSYNPVFLHEKHTSPIKRR